MQVNSHVLTVHVWQAKRLINGLLDNKEFICFPGCENNVPKGILVDKKVVVTNNLITSKAAGTTFDFAYEIIKYLTNEELAKQVLSSVYYK